MYMKYFRRFFLSITRIGSQDTVKIDNKAAVLSSVLIIEETLATNVPLDHLKDTRQRSDLR